MKMRTGWLWEERGMTQRMRRKRKREGVREREGEQRYEAEEEECGEEDALVGRLQCP